MYKKASKKIAEALIGNNVVKSEDREIYEYGFEVLISTAVSILSILIISITAKKVFVSVLFMLGFMTARLCCGGYHANHHLTCLMTTIINYIVFLVLTYFLGNSSLSIFTLAIAAASFILVFLFAPVEHEYNPLSPAEKKRHRIRSRLLVSIYLCLSVILILNGLFTDKIFSIGFGIFSVAVSLITAKIQCALKKRIDNKTANKVSGYENRAV